MSDSFRWYYIFRTGERITVSGEARGAVSADRTMANGAIMFRQYLISLVIFSSIVGVVFVIE